MAEYAVMAKIGKRCIKVIGPGRSEPFISHEFFNMYDRFGDQEPIFTNQNHHKPMKHLLITLATCITGSVVNAQAPPSFHADAEHGSMRYLQNLGQVYDTDELATPGIKYYASGSPMGIFLQEKSTVSLTNGTFHADTNSVDTLYRVDMTFHHAYERTPLPLMPTGELRHFYIRNEPSVENVPAVHRVYYKTVWDSVDVHFHHGAAGPRISFLINPGGDPSDIGLRFNGQDSIDIDLLGRLGLYTDNKWIKLPPATAFQYDLENTVTELYWIPSYVKEQGSDVVKFEFLSYNPALPLVFEIGLPPVPAMGGGVPEGNLTWSTSVGRDGYGVLARDYIFSADKLPDNDLIVTGSTRDSQFPAVTGTMPTVYGPDVFVSRFEYAPGDSENDARLLWTSVFGSGSVPIGHDRPAAIKYVPSHGKIYVAGWTGGSAFPMEPTSDPMDGSFYQSSKHGPTDGFILKLNLSGELERSSYYGGAGTEVITTITHDGPNGNVYFFGSTNSTTGEYNSCTETSAHLPLCDPGTGNYQQHTNAGGIDMFVARLDGDFRLTWGSFIGGTGDDRVLDSDSHISGASVAQVAICGSTTKSLPFETVGDFQLNSNTGPFGFVWIFKGSGAAGWGTQIHGTVDLQAVSFGKNRLRVMGTTDVFTNVNIQQGCSADPGFLSICGGDDDLVLIDHYIADFDALSKTMVWSTLIGGYTDASIFQAASRYEMDMPFGINRYMDLASNDYDHILAMGTFAKPAEPGTWFNTVEGFGMYNKPYHEPMGWEQSELFLSLYDAEHTELWTTTFGSHFNHIQSVPPGFTDWDMLHHGCDYGHGLVWVHDEVLYLVGTTGGHNFHRECPNPPPGPYCELNDPLFDAWIDGVDGMIARFDMREIVVGLPNISPTPATSFTVHPSPTTGMLSLSISLPSYIPLDITILDATGRSVLVYQNWYSGALDVSRLASGAYSVVASTGGRGHVYHARFIRE